MTRKYSLVIEGDSNGYSAYVPELPTILVTGASLEEIDSLATEAIRLYFENVDRDQPPALMVHQIEVELPAQRRNGMHSEISRASGIVAAASHAAL